MTKRTSVESKAESFHRGDKVEWESSNGEIKGTVQKAVTGTLKIKGHTVKATPQNPEIMVVSDKTGAKAAHKPDALRHA